LLRLKSAAEDARTAGQPGIDPQLLFEHSAIASDVGRALARSKWCLATYTVWRARVTSPRVEARYRSSYGEGPLLIARPEQIDALVDKLLTGTADTNVAVLYSLERNELPSGFPDHELRVGVDRDRQVGVVAFMDETGN
jgi:hypothetical protein